MRITKAIALLGVLTMSGCSAKAGDISMKTFHIRLIATMAFAESSCPTFRVDRDKVVYILDKAGWGPGQMTSEENITGQLIVEALSSDKARSCLDVWNAFGQAGTILPGLLDAKR